MSAPECPCARHSSEDGPWSGNGTDDRGEEQRCGLWQHTAWDLLKIPFSEPRSSGAAGGGGGRRRWQQEEVTAGGGGDQAVLVAALGFQMDVEVCEARVQRNLCAPRWTPFQNDLATLPA
ncbi:hypothetical protein DPEC_G00124800 [Dallia pectoralis]|uniref:Uncharacterized protein n=1 Tax=Dallia pectoralis TaxID=75939 RepID=A0ACC2GRD3_DALPE|nr:hypothetical protein DPEC_G00124800 [Dallia pectoralis]